MWHTILIFILYFLGAILISFLLLLLASKIWKKYKNDRKYLQNISSFTGASLKFRSGVGVYKKTRYKFFFPSLKHNALTLSLKAKSPIRLLIIKRDMGAPLFTLLKRVSIDDLELDIEYLFYSSNIEIAQRWIKDLAIKDELIGIMNSGCSKIDIRQNIYKIHWKRLTQLELKYLPEWVKEAIDRAVALKNLLLDYMSREDFIINPPVWRYLIIFAVSLISFAIIYTLILPLDIFQILLISGAVAMPFIFGYIYKIVSFSFRANNICLSSSILFSTLSWIFFIASGTILINSLFVDQEPKYLKIKSLQISPLFGDICLEIVKFENDKWVLTPTPVCSETKDNLDVKLYKGRLNFYWVDIDRVATKLSLVDVYSAFEAGNSSQALKLADKFIELNPKNIYGYYARAKILLKLKRYKEALEDMKKVLEINQHQIDAYLMIDKILTEEKNWKELSIYWTQLIKLEPQNAKAYYKRAKANLKRKEIDLAKKDLEESCKLGYQKACTEYKKSF